MYSVPQASGLILNVKQWGPCASCRAVAREPALGNCGFDAPSTDCRGRGSPMRDGRPISPLGPDRERVIPIAKRSQRVRANTAISFRFDAPRAGESYSYPYLPTRGAMPLRQCRGHFGGFTFHDAAITKIIDGCCGSL